MTLLANLVDASARVAASAARLTKVRELAEFLWTVYVRPELVVEVAFSDLQASVRYPGGLALRLARVKRYRADKQAADADTMDTMDTVRQVHAAQGGGSGSSVLRGVTD